MDVSQLASALDLWLCMWESEEQERFETAVVRAMTDANPRDTRLHAFALCHIVSTPRLQVAAQRVAAAGVFDPVECRALQIAAGPMRELVESGRRLCGDLLALERLLIRFVSDRSDFVANVTLDWVDVRDLVAVARTTVDARLFAEIERRIGMRGKYQRGRAANVLGFALRETPLVAPAAAVDVADIGVIADRAAAHAVPPAPLELVRLAATA